MANIDLTLVVGLWINGYSQSFFIFFLTNETLLSKERNSESQVCLAVVQALSKKGKYIIRRNTVGCNCHLLSSNKTVIFSDCNVYLLALFLNIVFWFRDVLKPSNKVFESIQKISFNLDRGLFLKFHRFKIYFFRQFLFSLIK